VSRFVDVSLGETRYRVPSLNLGEQRDLNKLVTEYLAQEDKGSHQTLIHNQAVGKLVLTRATPTIENFDQLECSPDELLVAIGQVLELTGLTAAGKAPAGAP
jgi:hypothetical protein